MKITWPLPYWTHIDRDSDGTWKLHISFKVDSAMAAENLEADIIAGANE